MKARTNPLTHLKCVGVNRQKRTGRLIAAAMVGAVLFGSTVATADDLSECIAGQARYNQNILQFNRARDPSERNPVCRAIQPEKGYAACQTFLRSKIGTQAQNDWATTVSASLVGVYKNCRAQ